MRHSILIGRCCALAASSVLAASMAAAQTGIQVVVNGQPVAFRGVGPQTVNGRVLVPLRGVLEKLGAYVDWQPAGQVVTATRGDIDIQLNVGSRVARVNGNPVSLDVPAMIYRGSTLVPLRFVSEALGADVRWDREQYAVVINTSVTNVSENRRPPVEETYGGNRPEARNIEITSFDMDRTGWLQPGTAVRFTLRGTAGGEATLSLPGVAREIPMTETAPGVYVATWTVPDDAARTNASRINAIARLRFGNSERLIQSASALTVDTTAPTLRSMTPDPDARITGRRPSISAVFDDAAGSGIDPRSVRVMLDDRDVTDQATITENFISYRPTADLTAGEHEVTISARDMAGNRVSRTWNFRVDTRGDEVIRSFEVTGARDARPGDVIRFRLMAEPGGRATFSVGDLVRNRAMREEEPGEYVGTYTVRRGDVFDETAITARFVSRSGEVYTVESTDRLALNAGTLEPPRITSPVSGAAVKDPMIISGTAPRNARIQIRVDYSTDVAGALRLRGTIAEVVVVADEEGRFRTDPINLDTLVRGRDTRYTITAVTLGSNGRRSEETTLTVNR